MALAQKEKEKGGAARRAGRTYDQGVLAVDRDVLTAYPGDEVGFSVYVAGPAGRRVAVISEGPPSYVALVKISPNVGTAPYAAAASVEVRVGAPPGVYPFSLVLRDAAAGRAIQRRSLILLVLDREISKEHVPRLSERLRDLVRIYRSRGAMWTVWHILRDVFKGGATFSQLKAAYEAVRGRGVSNGTVGNILRNMVKKGLIDKTGDLYHLTERDEEIVDISIDESRVRSALARHLPKASKNPSKDGMSVQGVRQHAKVPRQAERAFEIAERISERHGALAALHFLSHSVFGARETGRLLWWRGDRFIRCEDKTGFCTHFHSDYLAERLHSLGIQEGLLYKNTQDHAEARRIAEKYIHRYYGGFRVARRIYYTLKQHGLVAFDGGRLIIEITYYDDGDLGLKIYDKNRNLLYKENEEEERKQKRSIENVETWVAFPYDHTFERNELFYFEPARLRARTRLYG